MMRVKLKAHADYYRLSALDKAHICNGMGAKDSLLAKFIPNTMYGLDVTEAANRHDFRYHIGHSRAHKREADREFLENLFIMINNRGGWLTVPRMLRALFYYLCVHYGGRRAFYKE